MKTLLNTYCVPRTVEEHAMFQHLSTEEHFGVYFDNEYGVLCFDEGEWIHLNGTEIPVTRFLDLLTDRIAPWRLQEVGFDLRGNEPYTYHSLDVSDTFSLGAGTDGVWLRGSHLPAVTTFSELQTLIKFLTPKP